MARSLRIEYPVAIYHIHPFEISSILEGIAWLGGIDVGNVTGMEGSGKYKESMRWYERIIVQKLEIYYYADSIHIKA